MKNILLVQNIFVPDEKRLERNINSLKSLDEYIKIHGHVNVNLIIQIGGWAKTNELWNKFNDELHKLFNGNLHAVRVDKNYGKAMVNNNLIKMVDDQKIQYDYILTMDSDMVLIKEQLDFFPRLLVVAEILESKGNKPFGMISLQQTGENCHLSYVYENKYEYDVTIDNRNYHEVVVWPHHASGIAGGCLFISTKFWHHVGGYKVFGVYAGDDAHLLLDCGNMGYSYQMFDTLKIIHPHENDRAYADWKGSVCQRDTRTGTKNNIDHLIKEADDFWNKR